jgi:hypothetical protein
MRKANEPQESGTAAIRAGPHPALSQREREREEGDL